MSGSQRRRWLRPRHNTARQLVLVREVGSPMGSMTTGRVIADMTPLSELNEVQVLAAFPEADVDGAIKLLVEGIAIASDKPPLLERIRSAAIRVSGGTVGGLREAIALAQLDWRDLLVATSFADDVSAHLRWLPTSSGGPE